MKINDLKKEVITKEFDPLIKETLLKFIDKVEKNEKLLIDDVQQLIINIINRDKNPKFYTLKEVRELTKSEKKPAGLTNQYLVKEVQKGNLKAELIGRTYLVNESEAKRYLYTKKIFL